MDKQQIKKYAEYIIKDIEQDRDISVWIKCIIKEYGSEKIHKKTSKLEELEERVRRLEFNRSYW